MSLNSKTNCSILPERYNGSREGFEVFHCAISTWATARNPHVIRIMNGSAPFEGMSYADTLGEVPTFNQILKEFPVDGGVSVSVTGERSRVVKLEKKEGDDESSKEFEVKVEEQDESKLRRSGDRRKLQIYFDHWRRILKALIHANVTTAVTQKIIEKKVNVGDGQSAWNVIVLNALGTQHSHHLDVFFELLDLKCKGLKKINEFNQKFNSMLDSIRTSLAMDQREKVKDLPQSLKVGVYLKGLGDDFSWFRRSEVSKRTIDLEEVQERANTFAATERSSIRQSVQQGAEALVAASDKMCDNCGKQGHLSHRCFKHCKVCGKKDCHARKHKSSENEAHEEKNPEEKKSEGKDIKAMIAAAVESAMMKHMAGDIVGLSAEAVTDDNVTGALTSTTITGPKMDSGVNVSGCFPMADAHLFENRRTVKERKFIRTAAHELCSVKEIGDMGPHKNVALVGDGFQERLIGMQHNVAMHGPLLVTKDEMRRVIKNIPKECVGPLVAKESRGLYHCVDPERSDRDSPLDASRE